MRFIDLTNKVFGKLKVLERVGRCPKERIALWKCMCSCGNVTVAGSKYLRNGNKKSCGCLRKLPKGIAELRYWFKTYKQSAKKRNLKFSINLEDFKEIIVKSCHYCGESPKLREKAGLNGGYIMNGIDRINPKLGYIKNNLVPCCTKCNHVKWDMSLMEFKKHVSKIFKNLGNF